MISTLLMKLWIIAYVATAIISLYERNYPRALYYISAGSLTMAVLWGTR